MSKQYGFYFDESRCVNCLNCVVACKSVNDLEPGIKWIKIIDSWSGKYPDIRRKFMVMTCMHCEKPACAEACPAGAIIKRKEDGIVVVDKDKCNGCRECEAACPYNVLQFGSDGLMQKCDYCLSAGIDPECAASCPAEALKSGPLEKLAEMAEKNSDHAGRLEGKTKPAMIILS